MITPNTTLTLARRFGLAALAGSLITGLTGCGVGNSDDRFEYTSTAFSPKTISVIDVRTDETIWTYEVPVGSELRVNFSQDRFQYGDNKPTATMRFVEYPSGERGEIGVPARGDRRIDMELRDGPEEAPVPTADPVVPEADGD